MRYLILIFFIFLTNLIFSQKTIERSFPTGRLPWVLGDLPPDSNIINYRVVYGEGKSLQETRNELLTILVTDLGKDQGVTISDRTIQSIKEEISSGDPGFYSQSTSRELQIQFEEYQLTFIKSDEYFEVFSDHGKVLYKMWHLYAINGSPSYQTIKYLTRYPISTSLKSSVIPGWGQIEKKQTLKGLSLIGLTALTSGLTLKFNNDYTYFLNRRNEAFGLDTKKLFQKEMDKSSSLRTISFAGLIGIWIYNMIDVISVDGAPRYDPQGFKIGFSTNNPNNQLSATFNYKF